ncbi:MAG: hypothetical protein C0432_05980 [Candidatus Puniceispirillum sp.]|nr:hypothetical protein [Candidatus Pelagibacter sp.]MBA4283821.1 hypothetical protein [Candidatus Puniceispirillum sp.]
MYLKFFSLCLTLLASHNAYSARCSNFTTAANVDNKDLCRLIKEKDSNDFACTFGVRSECVTACHVYDAFEEDCIANKACEWNQFSIEHPCREKSKGWSPEYKRVVK